MPPPHVLTIMANFGPLTAEIGSTGSASWQPYCTVL